MKIIKLYSPFGDGGGGDDPKKKPPAGYKQTSPEQRRDWNDFLDYLQGQGIAGSKDLDQPDKNVAKSYIEKYKKENPHSSVSEELIPSIQYEQQAFRTGDEFPGLSKEQLGVLRKQVNPDYLKRPTADPGTPFNSILSREYYPQFHKGDKKYGTDMEGYLKDFSKPPEKEGPKLSEKTSDSKEENKGADRTGTIPLPNYQDEKSRLDYAQKITDKHGPLMHGRGDTFLRVNEIPWAGTDTAKNISTKAAKSVGIDPALLYASAMEEGMSGDFSDQKGYFKKEDESNPKFTVQGSARYGLDNFVSKFPELVKKGYLPSSFKDHFVPYHPKDGSTQDSAYYDTADSALQAKAAYLKSNYDEVDDYVKKNNIKLSPTARDFFALANYNGGKGVGLEMIKDYNNNGYLKDDAFMKNRPTKGEGLKDTSYGPTYDEKGKQTSEGVYTNVLRRIKAAKALKEEKLFE